MTAPQEHTTNAHMIPCHICDGDGDLTDDSGCPVGPCYECDGTGRVPAPAAPMAGETDWEW